jgi:hypothetical protein
MIGLPQDWLHNLDCLIGPESPIKLLQKSNLSISTQLHNDRRKSMIACLSDGERELKRVIMTFASEAP